MPDFVAHTTLHLHPGDGVVLYTDGVTEAEDMTREQYGLERLAAVLQGSPPLGVELRSCPSRACGKPRPY